MFLLLLVLNDQLADSSTDRPTDLSFARFFANPHHHLDHLTTASSVAAFIGAFCNDTIK